jgi:hypothetical protein
MGRDRVLRSFGPSAGRDELPLIRDCCNRSNPRMNRSSSLPKNPQLLLNYACNMMVSVYEFTICRVIIRF